MFRLRHAGVALVIVSLSGGAVRTANGQTRPTPEQAQQLLQTRPDLIAQLQAQLRSSGLTPDQIKARLRAEGYPENLLDAYLPNANPTTTPNGTPSDDVFGAMRALGLADTLAVDSLRTQARKQRKTQEQLDSAFLDTLGRAIKNDTVRTALHRVLRSKQAMLAATEESGPANESRCANTNARPMARPRRAPAKTSIP